MIDEIVERRENYLTRRQILERGEHTAWHTDPYHRFSVVVRGSALLIEYRDDGETVRADVSPGTSGWEAPTTRVHRATNVGEEIYEEVTLFLLDQPDAVAQPEAKD